MSGPVPSFTGSVLTTRLLVPGVVAAVVAAAGGFWWWQRRRRIARSLPVRLGRVAEDVLAGVLVPNADAGQIHIEFAVLTRRGILVLDVRNVQGYVFGSETMHEWTVLSGKRRFTFANPLPALYDRVAAVRRLVPDVPVEGYVGFTAAADFSKGRPPNVIMIDRLLEEIAAVPAQEATDGAPLQAAWERLRQAATVLG